MISDNELPDDYLLFKNNCEAVIFFYFMGYNKHKKILRIWFFWYYNNLLSDMSEPVTKKLNHILLSLHAFYTNINQNEKLDHTFFQRSLK